MVETKAADGRCRGASGRFQWSSSKYGPCCESLYTATHCNTLATHCNILQHTATHCKTLAARCNTLQHTHHSILLWFFIYYKHCNTLQQTPLYCKTLAAQCNTLQHTHYSVDPAVSLYLLQYIATPHNTLQHTVAHPPQYGYWCESLYTATYCATL